MSLVKLFVLFLKVGAILLGGGYVILPILTNEFCEKRKLLTEEELVNYFALSQSLPGIIAANMSMFIGYKLRGKFGALAAIIGIIFVPFLMIILLASILEYVMNNSIIQSALWGVGIAVIALIILSFREIWQKSDKNVEFYILFLFSLLLLQIVKLTPVQVILVSLILGILLKKVMRYRS